MMATHGGCAKLSEECWAHARLMLGPWTLDLRWALKPIQSRRWAHIGCRQTIRWCFFLPNFYFALNPMRGLF